MDISCSLCPVSYSLYLHSLLPRIRPAHRIQNGGDALWPNAPDTLELGGQALAQARQAEWLAGGNSLSDWLAHAKQVAGGATVGADAVGVAVLHAKNRGYVEQYRRDFSVGHSSTSLLYSCLRYVVLVR